MSWQEVLGLADALLMALLICGIIYGLNRMESKERQ